MNNKETRIRRTKKLRASLKKKESLRLCVSRSIKNISVQLIDSNNGVVLASASTNQKEFKGKNGGNIEAAKKIGEIIAAKTIKLGHKKVSFDRSGFKYHGRVKALAEGAREGGLEF